MNKTKYFIILSFFASILLLFISCNNSTNRNPQASNDNLIKVAVFNGNGASEVCVIETLEALKIDKNIAGKEISAAEIFSGKLSEFDALIFPGGSGSKELNNLGKKGKEIVQKFVREEGKGIIGICAGAYMLLSTENYPSLHISNVVHLDREHYNRGRGLVEFSLTEEGLKVFPELKGKKAFLQYYDGPVMQLKDSTLNSYTEFGKYVSDICPDNFAPAGITPGKTFLFSETIGKGKILAIAGHPESTPGMRWIVPRMVRIVTGNEIVTYDEFHIRPEIYDTAVFFDKALRKNEEKLFWNLLNDTAQVQIAAMDELHSYHSRPAVRWNIGLLRDINLEVRKHAAKLLKDAEYTAALPDLKAAYENEQDSSVKKQLMGLIEFFKKFNAE